MLQSIFTSKCTKMLLSAGLPSPHCSTPPYPKLHLRGPKEVKGRGEGKEEMGQREVKENMRDG